MPFPALPVAIGGAALLGLGGNILGSKSAKKSQQRSIEAQKEIAQNQYTWAVADLERAGLNPILAAQGGISGASASAPPAPVGVASQIDFAGNALDVARMFESRAKTENIANDTLLKIKQTEHEGAKIAATNQQARLHFQKTRETRVNIGKLMTEINAINVNIDKMEAETRVQHAQRVLINRQVEEVEKRKELLIQQWKMLRAELPAKERVGQMYRSWYGNFLGFIKAHMDALGISVGAILPVPVGGKGSSRVKGFGR